MNEEVKQRWIAALRSGKYAQGRHRLVGVEPRKTVPKYCCLGVLCELAVGAGVIELDLVRTSTYLYGTGNDWNNRVLPKAVYEWAGLLHSDPYVRGTFGPVKLSMLNDQGKSFNVIAELIEEQL